eukprot:166270_1
MFSLFVYSIWLLTMSASERHGRQLLQSQTCDNGGEQILILRLQDIANGFFSSEITTTGIENPGDENANTYSIIGILNPQDFINPNGEYEFYLVYSSSDATLRWAQTSWLTDSFGTGTCSGASGDLCAYAPGFREIQFDPPQTESNNDAFYGLGISDTIDGVNCYLDGTSLDDDFWNCVGAIQDWNGFIAGYNRGQHTGEALYVCKPLTNDPTTATLKPTDIPTSAPTNNPTSNPMNDPTPNPTKKPTPYPTNNPTANPTTDPTQNPTDNPTINPTSVPTDNPTLVPTNDPTIANISTQSQLSEPRTPIDIIMVALLILVTVLCIVTIFVLMLFMTLRKQNDRNRNMSHEISDHDLSNKDRVMEADNGTKQMVFGEGGSRCGSQSHTLIGNNVELQHVVNGEDSCSEGGNNETLRLSDENIKAGMCNYGDDNLIAGGNTLDEGDIPVHHHNVIDFPNVAEDEIIVGDDETGKGTVQ